MIIALPWQVPPAQISKGYDLRYYVDDPNERTVVAVVVTVFGEERYTLWADADYTAIGQWTDTQAQQKIGELFLAKHAKDLVPIAMN